MLTFDETTHVFRRDGERVWSVTQVLSGVGLIDDQWFHEGARSRGVRVHRALYRLMRESEDAALSELVPDDVPYFLAGQHWLRTAGVEVLGAEELVDGIDYAGWLDLRCRLRGDARTWVIDAKTGSMPRTVGLQTAAYARPYGPEVARGAIQLLPNGEPRLVPLTAVSDWSDFRSCLRVMQLRTKMRTT